MIQCLLSGSTWHINHRGGNLLGTHKRQRLSETEQRELFSQTVFDYCDKGIWISLKRKMKFDHTLFSECESIKEMKRERIGDLYSSPETFTLPDFWYESLSPEQAQAIKIRYQEHFEIRIKALTKRKKEKEDKLDEKVVDPPPYERRPETFIRLIGINEKIDKYLSLNLECSQRIYERYFDMIKEAYLDSCKKGEERVWLRPCGILNKDLCQYKKFHPELAKAESTVLQNAIREADNEWAYFFRRCKMENKKKRGSPAQRAEAVLRDEGSEYFKVLDYPVKKPKYHFMMTSSALTFDGDKIKIPKIDNPVGTEVISSSYKGIGRLTSATFQKGNNEWTVKLLYR